MRALLLLIGLGCAGSLMANACTSFGGDSSDSSSIPPPGSTGDDAGTDGPPSVVIGESGTGITLAVGDPNVTSYITQGDVLTLKVTLTRQSQSQGPVDITVKGLPAGVTADAFTIPAGELTATLTVHALATSVPGASAATEVYAHEQGQPVDASAKFTTFVRGTSGSLDGTFANGGSLISLYADGHGVFETQVLRDGSTLVTAKASNSDVISRLTPAGALDPGFGGTGTVVVAASGIGQGRLHLSAVEGATPAAGFIYALEVGTSVQTLYRFHLDGSADTNFSPSGAVVLDDGVTGNGLDDGFVQALSDGTALVSSKHGGAPGLITHWKADGTRDLAYGAAGSCAGAGQLLLRPNGGILSLGYASATDFTRALRGCTTSGLPDQAIGAVPDHTVVLTKSVIAFALTDTQNLLLLTQSPYPSPSVWSRLSPTYVKDTTIGDVGDVRLPSGSDTAGAMLAQPGGGVLVGAGLSIFAFTSSGSVNNTFGTAGMASLPVVDQDHGIQALIPYPDGRFIAVSTEGLNNGPVYMRFWQ